MPRPIPIADPDDPRIEPYREMRERDLHGRDGLFIAEGEIVLRLLLSPHSRFRPDSLLLAPGRVEAMGALLERVPADVPVYVAERAVLDRIAGFPIHRGVLAAARRGPAPDADALLAGLAGPALAVGLVGLANHDNVGGIFRNAAAFGADAVLLDAASCDPLYRKAIRVSVGACLTVPFARLPDAGAMLAALDRAGFTPYGLSPAGRERLEEVAFAERPCLLLGPEGPGLDASLLDRVGTVRIAMAEGFDSLNVATASGIALSAAFGRRRTPPRDD